MTLLKDKVVILLNLHGVDEVMNTVATTFKEFQVKNFQNVPHYQRLAESVEHAAALVQHVATDAAVTVKDALETRVKAETTKAVQAAREVRLQGLRAKAVMGSDVDFLLKLYDEAVKGVK